MWQDVWQDVVVCVWQVCGMMWWCVCVWNDVWYDVVVVCGRMCGMMWWCVCGRMCGRMWWCVRVAGCVAGCGGGVWQDVVVCGRMCGRIRCVGVWAGCVVVVCAPCVPNQNGLEWLMEARLAVGSI